MASINHVLSYIHAAFSIVNFILYRWGYSLYFLQHHLHFKVLLRTITVYNKLSTLLFMGRSSGLFFYKFTPIIWYWWMYCNISDILSPFKMSSFPLCFLFILFCDPTLWNLTFVPWSSFHFPWFYFHIYIVKSLYMFCLIICRIKEEAEDINRWKRRFISRT